MRLLLFLLPLFCATAQTPAPPSTLTVVSATNKEVKLRWAAAAGESSYVVERKPVGGSYERVARAGSVEIADTRFDPYTPYTYRVRSARGEEPNLLLSAPSKEVTAGPPARGLQIAAPSPTGANDANYGMHVAIALDSNGDPGIAFLYNDPDGDGDGKDSTLHYLGWDRAHWKWRPLVQVDTPGLSEKNWFAVALSAASDAATGTIGLAYQKSRNQMWLATSTDLGQTWNTELIDQAGDTELSHAAVAMRDGRVHVVYHADASIRYAVRAGATGKFEITPVPPLPGSTPKDDAPPAVEVDGSGKAAVAYWVGGAASAPLQLAVWRPRGQPVKVLDSKQASDYAQVRLRFHGTAPRIVFAATIREDLDDYLWFTHSVDGTKWETPVKVERDIGQSWYLPISLALDSKGAAAIGAPVNVGAGNPVHGRPKIMKSTDLKKWTMSSPTPRAMNISVAWWPQIVYAGNDRLYAAFLHSDDNPALKKGVVLWRE